MRTQRLACLTTGRSALPQHVFWIRERPLAVFDLAVCLLCCVAFCIRRPPAFRVVLLVEYLVWSPVTSVRPQVSVLSYLLFLIAYLVYFCL